MYPTNGHERVSTADPWARPYRPARALDGYSIDLPPATGGDEVSATAISSFADLYQLAELEQVGIIPAVEALVEARSSLQVPSERLAEVLEGFANGQRNWYDRTTREQLFARLFGIGGGATSTSTSDGAVNHDFEQRLATLCVALNRFAIDQGSRAATTGTDLAQVSEAASALVANLSLRQYGNTAFTARRLHDQLQAATVILKDGDVQSMFGVRSFWQTLGRILAPNVPDVARLLERGSAGRLILLSLSPASTSGGTTATPSAELTRAAASWLAASGLDPNSTPRAGSGT